MMRWLLTALKQLYHVVAPKARRRDTWMDLPFEIKPDRSSIRQIMPGHWNMPIEQRKNNKRRKH